METREVRPAGPVTVLFLGYGDSPLIEAIRGAGDRLIHTADRIDAGTVERTGAEFAVSFGYRHLIGPDVLAALPGSVVNLHISLLPCNRGADPNFWSAVEQTPAGVSIHHVDEGLDTGELILQEAVHFDGSETLRTSYATLIATVEALFRDNWEKIRRGELPSRPQRGRATFHRSRDKQPFLDWLGEDWLDMTRRELCSRYRAFTAARPAQSGAAGSDG